MRHKFLLSFDYIYVFRFALENYIKDLFILFLYRSIILINKYL